MPGLFEIFKKNTKTEPEKTNVGTVEAKPQVQSQPSVADMSKDKNFVKEQKMANVAIENFSRTKQEILNQFDEVEHDEDVWNSLRRKSEFYDKKKELYRNQLKELQEKGDEYIINPKLTILSKQAEELLAGTDDARDYPKLVHSLKNEFADQSSAKGVLYGANELNEYVFRYLTSLKNAMRDGQKMKVSCCKDILLYILRVGYREEDEQDPNAQRRILDKKVNILKKGNLCDELIKAIDQCCSSFIDCETREESYGKSMQELEKMFANLEDIPSEIMDKIGGLSFKYANKNLSDTQVQKIMPTIIKTSSATATADFMNAKIIADVNELAKVSVNVEELMLELRTAYRTPYNEFNYDEFNRCIEERRNMLANEIQEMQNFISAGLELDRETEAVFKAVREDQRLAQNTATATERIREQMKIRKKIDNYERQVEINKRKREVAEAKLKERLKQEQEALEQELAQQEESISNGFIENEPELLENE